VTGFKKRHGWARESEALQASSRDGEAWFDVVPLAFDGVLHDLNRQRACAGDAVVDGAKQAVLVRRSIAGPRHAGWFVEHRKGHQRRWARSSEAR
jgi:hypothetical protein